MARYAIGDLQGCFYSLMHLLDKIAFDANHDELWFVGDLINRGQGSLAVMRWLYQHQASIKVVLGNHDLHAIAVAHGVRPPHRFDTLSDLLLAADGGELLHWLRHQPLMVFADDYAMVHAGLYPQWSLTQAKGLAEEVEAVLQSPHYADFLQAMYGNQPAQWSDQLMGIERWRAITNALTRMRICDAQGAMEFTFKGELAEVPEHYWPWFLAPVRCEQPAQTILFGHWSALGLYQGAGVIGLDTGCLWGRTLTAYALDTQDIVQVPLDLRDQAVSGSHQD